MRQYSYVFLLTLFTILGCQSSGPQTTERGNTYVKHTNSQTGKAAAPGDYVYLHAVMRTVDSVLFSTRENSDEPAAIVVPPDSVSGQQVGPVEDVVRNLRAGDSVTITIRIDTLDFKPPGLENEDEFYYDIAIKEVVDEAEFKRRREVEQAEKNAKIRAVQEREPETMELATSTLTAYKEGKLDNIQETSSGLKYIIHQEGTGDQAQAGDIVTVHYIGLLVADGSNFDQSFNRGEAISFPLGQGRVISGWEEGLTLLNKGTKASFFIPSDLAYGAAGTPDGSIPPASELMFYVEMEDVRK
ncbi:MAG: FKBP-type peptidyl-prolyl cis-trans isomerase [Bacteroidota bacterium]